MYYYSIFKMYLTTVFIKVMALFPSLKDFSTGFRIIAKLQKIIKINKKLCDKQKFMILTSLLITIIFTNKHNFD